MMPIIIFVIDTNTFLKDKLPPLFSNAIAKMYQFRRSTRCIRYELLHTTKVLVISIFTPLFHNGFIGEITKVFENKQTTSDEWV